MKKTKKKLTTFLTVLALLLLIIPTGALFADTINPDASGPSVTTTTEEIKTDEDTEDSEEAKEVEESEADETEGTGEMSDRAVYVADRNAVAETLGIAPGYLNNIDKLAAAADAAGISGMTREELLADFEDASMQDIQREIKKFKNEAKAKHQK